MTASAWVLSSLLKRTLNVGVGGAEAELLLELRCTGNLLHLFDAEGELGVRTGIAGAHETSEARHQADLVGLDLVVRAVESRECDNSQRDPGQGLARSAQPVACLACET